MIIKIPKPQNEADFVNLYNTIVTMMKEKDEQLHDYLLEPNICDDCTFEEIIEMLGGYCKDVRDKHLAVETEEKDFWRIKIE